jgi:hypothetical protein
MEATKPRYGQAASIALIEGRVAGVLGDTPKVEETGKADERRTKNVKERAPRSAGRRMGGYTRDRRSRMVEERRI